MIWFGNILEVLHLKFCVAGWLDCPAYGDEVDFFIPSKVPLGDSFRERISPDKRYTPRDVIYEQRRLGREVGLDS